MYKIDVPSNRVGVTIIYHVYEALDKFFTFQFIIANSNGEIVPAHAAKPKTLKKNWKELTFEFDNTVGTVELTLLAFLKTSSIDPTYSKMFFVNVGQVSIYDVSATSTLKGPEPFCIETIPRRSFKKSAAKNTILIDLYFKTCHNDPNIRIKSIVFYKDVQFVQNVYFKEYVITNLRFQPDSDGCERYGATAVTEEGFFIEHSKEIIICEKDIRPVLFRA